MKIIHFSDTHLGGLKRSSEREQDFKDTFSEVIDYAITNNVDLVIHSGDMFDNQRPPPSAIYHVLKELSRLHEHEIPLVAIAGNHDMTFLRGRTVALKIYEELDYLHLLSHKNPHVEIDGVFIAGIQYFQDKDRELFMEYANEISNLAKDYSDSIFISHQGVKELIFEKTVAFYQNFSVEDFPSNFSYVALGHVHKRNVQRINGTLFSYAGSTEIWRKDEIPSDNGKVPDKVDMKKSFNLIELQGGKASLKQVPLKKVRPHFFIKVNAKDLEHELEKLNSLQDMFNKPPELYFEIITSDFSDFMKKEIKKVIEKNLEFKPLRRSYNFKPIELEIRNQASIQQTLNINELLVNYIDESYPELKKYKDLIISLKDLILDSSSEEDLVEYINNELEAINK